MTDTRLRESFLTHPQVDALSDEAFRVYVCGLVYAVSHGTDGALPDRCLRLLHPEGRRHDAAADLVAADLWRVDGDGWLIRNFLTYQTPAADVKALEEARKAQRAAEAERKRRRRADPARRGSNRVGGTAAAVTPHVLRDVPQDVTQDAARDSTGQDSDSDSDSDSDRTAQLMTTSPALADGEDPADDPWIRLNAAHGL